MNQVTGRVVHKETNEGLSNLLVVVYDIDPELRLESIFDSDGSIQYVSLRDSTQIFRLGSVLTTTDGSFRLEYEDNEFQTPNQAEIRPDLFVCVVAPEDNAQSGLTVVHASPEIRYNAGRSETYLIYVTTEQLKAAGLNVPESDTPVETEPEKPEDILARVAQAEEDRLKLNEGLREIYAKRTARKQEIKQRFENDIKQPLLKSLSKVPSDLARPETFVRTDEGAEAVSRKTTEAIKVRLRDVINKESSSGARAPVKGYVTLTEEQEKRLREAGAVGADGQISDIPEAEFETLFARTNDNTEQPTFFLQADPIARYCRQKTAGEKCLDEKKSVEGDGSDRTDGVEETPAVNGEDETDGVGGTPAVNGEDDTEEESSTEENSEGTEATGTGLEIDLTSNDGIPRYVASLIEQTDPTFSPIAFDPNQRAGQTDVLRQIKELSLDGGPADVPAFYDFYNLQIAFEHIWQEAIDQGVVDNAENLYETIVELGGDPGDGSIEVILRNAANTRAAVMTEPDSNVVQVFDITLEQWNALEREYQNELIRLSGLILSTSPYQIQVKDQLIPLPLSAIDPETPPVVGLRDISPKKRVHYKNLLITFKSYLIQLRRQGERIIQYAQNKVENPSDSSLEDIIQFHNTLKQLRERLQSDYAFTAFAAKDGRHSINFGLLLTYRQRWEPQAYQAGELVKTITLAPKEMRKFSKKTVRNRKRSEKEVANNLYSLREESNGTSRAESEIIRNAQSKTNFNLTANGSYNTGVWNANMQASFGTEASKSSNETKKEFREAVHKAAEEYKNERKTEVNTEELFEDEYTESGEIMNPNDELPVTFLFYELQRRYIVSERLHRVLPVVLVAQEIPNPADIDEDWIITHDWILRRVLLDDSFIPALDYLSTQIVGDEFALKEMKKHIDQQKRIISDLKEEVVEYRDLVGQRYAALERAIRRSASAAADDDSGLLESAVEFFIGDDTSTEAARVRERAARDAYEKAVQDEKEIMGRLNRAIATHNAAVEAYTEKLGEHLNRKAQISRLQVHIKQNILHYMQAIWLHEPPDQRFLRLHKVEVPVFEGEKSYKIKPSSNISPYLGFSLAAPENNTVLANPHEYEVDVNIEPDFETKPLVEVADIDNLLGFRGNYMIFRLQKSNVLTEFMIAPYIDREFNTVYDPDVEGTMTLDEFSDFVCCLEEELEPELFERIKPELNKLLGRLLTSPLRDNEEIVVPTDSLFIEALPGKHPILEDFKLMHRAIDVNLADAQHKEQILENVRRIARLLDNQLEDPEITKKIVVEGSGTDVTVTDNT